jgi:hypothetical protein
VEEQAQCLGQKMLPSGFQAASAPLMPRLSSFSLGRSSSAESSPRAAQPAAGLAQDLLEQQTLQQAPQEAAAAGGELSPSKRKGRAKLQPPKPKVCCRWQAW